MESWSHGVWQADAGGESGWGEDSEDVVGHGGEKEVPGLANGSHLPPWDDYNPAP